MLALGDSSLFLEWMRLGISNESGLDCLSGCMKVPLILKGDMLANGSAYQRLSTCPSEDRGNISRIGCPLLHIYILHVDMARSRC